MSEPCMKNEHCYNCLNTGHCANFGKEVCAYDGDEPKDFEAEHCAKDCFLCKYEDDCVSSCKGEKCSTCRFYERICKGQ